MSEALASPATAAGETPEQFKSQNRLKALRERGGDLTPWRADERKQRICCFMGTSSQSRIPSLEGQALPENKLIVSN